MIFVANLHAHPHTAAALREGLLHVAALTERESGAVAYSVRQHLDDPTRFQVSEHYRDREAWQTHMASPYVQALIARFDALLQAPPALDGYAELYAPTRTVEA